MCGSVRIRKKIKFYITKRTKKEAIGELFNTTRNNITIHLQDIYNSNELEENSTSKEFLLVQKEGNRDVKRNVKYYNLDAVISVGYRVLSDDRDILKDAGKISHEIACDKALTEFEKYRVKQDRLYQSDFDKLLLENERSKY